MGLDHNNITSILHYQVFSQIHVLTHVCPSTTPTIVVCRLGWYPLSAPLHGCTMLMLTRPGRNRQSSTATQRTCVKGLGARMRKFSLVHLTQRQNECACSADLWFERESITNAPLQSPNSHLLPQYFFCWIRYVMEETRRNLSWKRQPYLFWFGLIPAK